MPLNFPFDFKNPDYAAVFKHRIETLVYLRAQPERFIPLREFYRSNPAQFIIDWGCTADPRNLSRGRPTVIPFLLFPKQEEWVNWIVERWKNEQPCLTDKSRDMGLSWLSIALGCTLCAFNPGMNIGYGSRKAEYVDKLGSPRSIFEKGRQFLSLLPEEFRPGWNARKDAPHMSIKFPWTGSIITGEAGDNLGRGDRASIYFIDESAFLERPDKVEAALSEASRTRVDISTPRGRNNPFAEKRFRPGYRVMSMHWRDHPAKSQEWYEKRCEEIGDPVIIAQELDLDYSASVEGVLIPSAWVQAAVDAHIKLGVKATGRRKCSFDVADEGYDQLSVGAGVGVVFDFVRTWSGKGSDIYESTDRSFSICDELGVDTLVYDADGLGAGVRGDARKINELRKANGVRTIEVIAFRGSGKVIDPKDDPFQLGRKIKSSEGIARTNEDYLANAKAQAWWVLRLRFAMTHRAVTEGKPFDPDEIISISSETPELSELISELSQPTYSQNNKGQLLVNKMPDGARSPNRADAFMIWSSRTKRKTGFFNVDTTKNISRFRR